jgi:Zn-dependent protease
MTECAGCSTVFPAAELSCPACQRLVHADRLRELAQRAETHAAAGEREAELTTWRSVLELLPPGSRQHEQISTRLAERLAAGPAPQHSRLGTLAALGSAGFLLWKFKWLVALVLTKGKLLLLGLTKASTFFSMLLSLGLYASLWGWKFGLGILLSLYVHEIGHVAALKRLGIAATAPMFVPGLGAFVRSSQYPATPVEDAAVGLAGPIWGLGAALACFAVSVVADSPLFAALARTGAWINLFNLVPFGSLDGGRGFRALDRSQRWIATGLLTAAWVASAEGLLVLLAIAAGARTLWESPPERSHWPTLALYGALVAALTWLSTLHVPVPTQ